MGQDIIKKAALAVQNGSLVVYPTDTQYALGAGITHEQAIQNIFRIKKRPITQPLPVAVASLDDMNTIAEIPRNIHHIISHYLPGPLTALLQKKPAVTETITAGSPKIAVRIPKNTHAITLLKQTGPLTVTSANLHTQPPPTTIDKIKNLFSNSIAVYINDGDLKGQPSTIVDFTTTPPTLIRKGPIQLQDILDMIK